MMSLYAAHLLCLSVDWYEMKGSITAPQKRERERDATADFHSVTKSRSTKTRLSTHSERKSSLICCSIQDPRIAWKRQCGSCARTTTSGVTASSAGQQLPRSLHFMAIRVASFRRNLLRRDVLCIPVLIRGCHSHQDFQELGERDPCSTTLSNQEFRQLNQELKKRHGSELENSAGIPISNYVCVLCDSA